MHGSMMQVYHNFVNQVREGKGIKTIVVTTANIQKLEQVEQLEQSCLCPFYLPAKDRHLSSDRVEDCQKKTPGKTLIFTKEITILILNHRFNLF